MVNAAHTFYNGTTTLPISEEDRTPRKRISKTLNMTTNPEEKRKIIGDTFVKVRVGGRRRANRLRRAIRLWRRRVIVCFHVRRWRMR